MFVGSTFGVDEDGMMLSHNEITTLEIYHLLLKYLHLLLRVAYIGKSFTSRGTISS